MSLSILDAFQRAAFRGYLAMAALPSLATIEAKAVALDAYGQEIESWAAVPGLQMLGCAKAALSAEERQAAHYTATDQAWHVLLAGAYPAITTVHRAVVDGEAFDIDAREIDQAGTITRLRVRLVTT